MRVRLGARPSRKQPGHRARPGRSTLGRVQSIPCPCYRRAEYNEKKKIREKLPRKCAKHFSSAPLRLQSPRTPPKGGSATPAVSADERRRQPVGVPSHAAHPPESAAHPISLAPVSCCPHPLESVAHPTSLAPVSCCPHPLTSAAHPASLAPLGSSPSRRHIPFRRAHDVLLCKLESGCHPQAQ